MFLVQKVCYKIPALNLTVCRVSPIFTLSAKEAFLEGSNVLNTETLMVPFIWASVIHPSVSYDIQIHKSSTRMKNNQQKPRYPIHQHTFEFFPNDFLRTTSYMFKYSILKVSTKPNNAR